LAGTPDGIIIFRPPFLLNDFLFIVYLKKKKSTCAKISFLLKKIIEVVKRQQGNLFPITSPLIDGD
jgi:hypothetical protein